MTTETLKRGTPLRFRSLKDLKRYKVLATDGEVGKVDDLYFDDVTWTLRYFVVDTGNWLSTNRVLVSPAAFADSDGSDMTIATGLTRKQIENAPAADLAKPVSRQFEIKLHDYYAWPIYWLNAPDELQGERGDSHLRSVAEVIGYGISATDGKIGHVEDLIAEERSWIIRYLAIDTRNWLPGRKVIISPYWTSDVRWADNTVVVDLTRESIKNAPAYSPAQPVNRAYEEKLYDYYGRPRYWTS